MSARGLFATWGAYWLVLLAIGGRPAARMVAFASRAPHGRASMSAGFNDGMLRMTAVLDGRQVMTSSLSLLALALWIAGPPLLLWALWISRPPRRSTGTPDVSSPLLPADRWTPTSYHEALRRETMREPDEQ